MQCQIISKYFESISAINEIEKMPRDYGLGQLLYHSEINLIEAIYKHSHSNVIELSRIMCMTRGAVTQIGNKLESKGLIEKYSIEGNKKERYYRLTDLGRKAQKGHEAYHKEANKKICDYIGSLKGNEVHIIMDFLEKLALLPVSEFDCKSNCYIISEEKNRMKEGK